MALPITAAGIGVGLAIPYPTGPLRLFLASALVVAVLGTLAYGAFWPRSRLMAPVIFRGSRHPPARVALTLDDGPHPEVTPALLDALARVDATATFFVIGAYAQLHAELLRRIDAAGHCIGNHSYDHAYSGMFRSSRYWSQQLERTEQAVEQAIGKRPRLFRPPLGFKQPLIARAAARCGYAMVTWSHRGRDGWPASTEQILDRLVETAAAGDILTLHDGMEGPLGRNPRATIEAIEPLVLGLRRRGLEIERLDRLIGVPAYAGLDGERLAPGRGR